VVGPVLQRHSERYTFQNKYISKLESDQKSLPLWQACLSLCRTISAFVVKDREDLKEEVNPVPNVLDVLLFNQSTNLVNASQTI